MKRRESQPTPSPRCPHCGELAHEGYTFVSGVRVATPQELIASIDPEACVYFDRDVCLPGAVADLCGPRLRTTAGQGLLAHFGSPAGDRYVVFNWRPKDARWKCVIDTAGKIAVEAQ